MTVAEHDMAYAVGEIGNYYGGLTVLHKTDGTYAWSIQDWDGERWQIIPAYLGEALLKFAGEQV